MSLPAFIGVLAALATVLTFVAVVSAFLWKAGGRETLRLWIKGIVEDTIKEEIGEQNGAGDLTTMTTKVLRSQRALARITRVAVSALLGHLETDHHENIAPLRAAIDSDLENLSA